MQHLNNSSVLTHQSETTRLKYHILSAIQTPGGIKTTIHVFNGETLLYSDSPNITSAKTRTQFANKVADITKLSPKFIEKDLISLDLACQKVLSDNKAPQEESSIVISPEDEASALEFLRQPNIIELIKSDIKEIGVVGEETNSLIVYLVGTSRLMDDPLSIIVKGSSSAGKSQLAKRVISLFPEEAIKEFVSISAKALSYMDENALKHKVLIIAERHGSETGDYQIRVLQSEKGLAIATTIKDPKTGNFKVQEKVVSGPIAYIETTTNLKIHPENETRNFSIYVDESPEQTQRIQERQKAKYLLESDNSDQISAITKKHKTLQRLLKSYRVDIPFAKRLKFHNSNPRARRDFARFLALLECIVILHQKQRKIKVHNGKEFLEATYADYRIAYDVAHKIFEFALISPKSRELLSFVKLIKADTFTSGNLINITGWTYSEVRKYIKPLVEIGQVEELSGRQGQIYVYRLTNKKVDERLGLISPDELESSSETKDLSKAINA